MASVSQGHSRPASHKPVEPTPPPPSNIHRSPPAQPTKTHPSHHHHRTNAPISAAPTSTAWHQSVPTLPQQHSSLPLQQMPAQAPATAQFQGISKSSQRSQEPRHTPTQHTASASAAFQASRPLSSSHNEAPILMPPPRVDRQLPVRHPSHHMETAHPPHQAHQQLQPAAHSPLSPAEHLTRTSRPETVYIYPKQQRMRTYLDVPRQDPQQHLVQQPVQPNVSHHPHHETPQRHPDSPQMGTARLAPQQLVSQHSAIESSQAQSQVQRKQSEGHHPAEMQQLHHQSVQMTHRPVRRTYRIPQGRDSTNRFHRIGSDMNGTQSSYPPQHGAGQIHHITQKQSTQHQRAQDIQHVVPQGQQSQQTTQNQQAASYPAGHPIIANSTSTLTIAHNTAKPIAAERHAPNGQIYQVQMAIPQGTLPQGTIPVSGAPNAHYAGPSYQYATLFDPLSMNPSLSNAALAQAVGRQDMTVLRTRDRQGQEVPVQHVQGRPGVQGLDRSGVVAQDMHGLVEHGQQQVIHRASVQGPGEHELQGRGAPPHAIRANMYPPMDHQHATQQVVITQPAIQPHAGQVTMHNQSGQVAQHAPIQSQDGSFEQRMYQVGNPTQIAPTVVVTPQQDRDQQQPKAVNASNQQRLLPWGNANPNVRVVAGGITQQPNGETPNVLAAQGTLITQPQVYNMAAQNGTVQQVTQQVAIHKVQRQSQHLLPNMRRMPQTPGEPSPRKRRQLNPAGTSVINSVIGTRTFSCSGCAQEFSRKRDRDNHVRTVHERSFACSKCQARFKTKSDANRHIRIVHERIRPYQCPSCPSMFSERNKLRRHKETVHEKLRPYVCPVCSARFGELGNLRQHTGSLHPDYQVEHAQRRSRVNNQVQS